MISQMTTHLFNLFQINKISPGVAVFHMVISCYFANSNNNNNNNDDDDNNNNKNNNNNNNNNNNINTGNDNTDFEYQ